MPIRSRRKTGKFALVWVFMSSVSAFSTAETVTVAIDGSGDHTTIQAAIDAAAVGDTVKVAAGIYRENIAMKSGVKIIGEGPEDTIIDGCAEGPVVTANSVDPNARLEALGITNGSAENGGGILCTDSSPIIANCSIWKNTASALGGGMYNHNSSPTIVDCSFSSNVATGPLSSGGGICNVNGSNPMVTNCTFSSNKAIHGFGGAMANSVGSSPRLINVVFSSNVASNGGAIHNDSDSDPNLVKAIFSANVARLRGGAMQNLDCDPIITDCVFSANRAAEGAALYSNNSTLRITNCTFSANMAGRPLENPFITNALEAVLWLTVGVISIFAVAKSAHPNRFRLGLMISATFFLIVLLELHEAAGGTLWTPVGLVWAKAVCASILLMLFILYRKTDICSFQALPRNQ